MRTLDKDAYDALELSALAFGGIGAGRFLVGSENWRTDFAKDVPYCIAGHAAYLTGDSPLYSEVAQAVRFASIMMDDNDQAVRAINARKKRAPNARVTFREWAKELGVQRGA